MPTARFCRLIGVPERTWRRHQARGRQGAQARGPWPRPARESVRETARRHALAHSAWGHRKVWAMCRHDGHRVSQATVLRLLRDEGLLLEANYQRERRQLAARRNAAFATEPTGPNQVWQLDFSEFETTGGGIWRLAGCRDYWSKYELGWHVSPTANQHDYIAAIESAPPRSAAARCLRSLGGPAPAPGRRLARRILAPPGRAASRFPRWVAARRAPGRGVRRPARATPRPPCPRRPPRPGRERRPPGRPGTCSAGATARQRPAVPSSP
ncbi:IS3 family transposase [Streptacidiphilus pinicola]|uniref:IS3 family transposase n=1 Tax=Streptacidiphilus pinicola TaxID=2219663 RepID=UPI00267A16F2